MSANRGAQLFSFDLISSLTVFMIFFTIFFFAYGQLKLQTAQATAAKDAQDTATFLSDELVRTPGIPANWTNTTVVTIGLAEEDGVLALSKLRALGNMSYQNSTFFLVLGNFEYFLNLTALNNATLFTYGWYPPQNITTVTPIKRMVLLHNDTGRQLAILRLIVWK